MLHRGVVVALAGMVMLSNGCGGDDIPPLVTPSPTASVTVTRPATSTVTVTSTVPVPPTATATAPAPPTATVTAPAPTASATPAHSPTPDGAAPPQITHFGVARADDFIEAPDLIEDGRPVYLRPHGQALTLVLEGRRGSAALGNEAYDAGGGLPDAQFLVSRPLGDGSLAVCDASGPLVGGIPGTNPPEFSDDPAVVDAINDLGCRVNDGTGSPLGRTGPNACTKDAGAEFGFVDVRSERQFCLPISRAWAFPLGDTIVAARLRDVRGNLSEAREIVVRVAGGEAQPCDPNGIGEHTFTIERTASRLQINSIPTDASLALIADPIRICAGPDFGGGVHDLTLRADANIGLLRGNGVLCLRLLASGSDGNLDCAGILGHDVRAVQSADGSTVDVDTGLGQPAGTGAASLSIPMQIRQLPPGSRLTDCRSGSGGDEVAGALTTAVATAVVLDEQGMPGAQLSLAGTRFDCRAWRLDHRSALVLPLPGLDTAQGDVAAVLLLHE